MSAKHTPGPWHQEGNHIVAGSVRVAVVDTPRIHAGVDEAESEANARRIVACWNALLPFSTEEIEAAKVDLVKLQTSHDAMLAELQGQVVEARQELQQAQRDQVQAAAMVPSTGVDLKPLHDLTAQKVADCGARLDRLQALVNKATGGKA